MVALSFNATQVAPNAALEAIPSGVYPVIITRTEEKPTRAGDGGAYIEFEMTVQGGEFNGRKVFDRLNIRNKNQQAVDIAYGTLSAICHVTGRHHIQDTGQLHGIPFQAVVAKVGRDDRPGEFSNEVKGYKDAQGNDPGKSGAPAAPQAQPNWAGQGGAPGGMPNGQPQQYAQPAPNGQAPQQQYAPPQGQAPQGQPQYGAPPHQGEQHAVNPPQQGAPAGGPPPWNGQPQQPPAQQPQQPQQYAQAPQQPPQQPQAPQGGQPGFVPGAAPPWAGGQAAAPQG